MQIKPDEITSILKSRIEGLDSTSADLTVQATELVTRKVLTEEDQRRLVEDAMSELDFTVLSSGLGRQP